MILISSNRNEHITHFLCSTQQTTVTYHLKNIEEEMGGFNYTRRLI